MFTKALHALAKIAYLFCCKFDKLKMLQPVLMGLAMDADDTPLSVLGWADLAPDQLALLHRYDARISLLESGVFISARDEILQSIGYCQTLALHLSRTLGVSSLVIKSPSRQAVLTMKDAQVCIEVKRYLQQ